VYPTFTLEDRQKLMLKAIEIRKSKPKKHKKVKTPVVKAVAVSKPIPPTSLNKNPNAEQIVNTMSVGLAKAVYLELKKVFEA
jgi:hypothetical protein